MKTHRCKYGHKIEHKTSIVTTLRNVNWDKFGVLTAGTAFISYAIYLKIVG